MRIDSSELQDLLGTHAEACGVAGAAIGVFCEGEAVTACVGMADEEAGVPVSNATLFQAGSLSKSMVATVIARLVDRGHFGFDDPIAQLVPELAASAWGKRATVRHLLAQTALVQPPPEDVLGAIDKDGEDCFAATCELLADQPMRAEPGQIWSYGVGWSQLARLIEVATSTPWARAMRSELFEPLEMSSTAWGPELDAAAVAAPYSVKEGKRTRIDPDPDFEQLLNGPAGGVRTTIEDLLAFGRAHVDPAENYCGRASLAALRERQSTIAIPSFLDGWCLGWGSFDWKGGPVWGWEGILPGHRAMLRILPEHGGVIAQLANTSSGRALYRSLFPVLLDRCFGVEMPNVTSTPVEISSDELSRFEGSYGWPGTRVVVEARGDRLTLQGPNQTVDAFAVGDAWFLQDPNDPDQVGFTFTSFDVRGRPELLYVFLSALPRCDEG